MNKFKQLLLAVVMGSLLLSCSIFKGNKGIFKVFRNKANVVKSDTARKIGVDSLKKGKVRPYKEIITSKAITDSGLFIVHKIEDKYFFEIPKKLLEKDILVVGRISKAAAEIRPFGETLGYSGDKTAENQIRFSMPKGIKDKVFIKLLSYRERSVDSTANGMYRSVKNSNVQPIIASFDVKAYNSDSTGIVIDITDFISSDNNLIFQPPFKTVFVLGGLQKDKSFIAGIESFPNNVEIHSENTYAQGDATSTFELNTSFVLLPEYPMRPRIADARIGYFSRGYIDFDSPKNVELNNMITRWRLEPKDEDKDRYLRGELVEPKKPIVYYIDPATPKKWVPYLIQGVNDWQKAFEKAGFKNAIYALEAPKNDPEFNLFDARHNAIIYKPSIVPNASGPHIHDPRTGEILETHINWYHNVMSLIHDWYMIQAGPNDPQARKMIFDDVLMGRLIRFVSSHEVGHTLGLMHNFMASSTVPTDSLRNKVYIQKYGYCPSIMDYARFNYVAQPQDRLTQDELIPKIGVYDEWAIEWGYRWLPELDTREKEVIYMDNWISKTLTQNKRLQYNSESLAGSDPRVQSEDLGDDAIKAGNYGIENLKKVMGSLREWTKEPGANYESLAKMNSEVISQYSRYIMHVANNVGYYTWTPKSQRQQGDVVGYITKAKQKAGINFLNEQLFNTPNWLMNKNIFPLVGGYGINLPSTLQEPILAYVLNPSSFSNLSFANLVAPKSERYSFDEMMTDLEKGILREIKEKLPVDYNRRSLQRIYVLHLIALLRSNNPLLLYRVKHDFMGIVQSHGQAILNDINDALVYTKDKETRMNYFYLRDQLREGLKPKLAYDLAPVQYNSSQTRINIDAANSLLPSSKTKSNCCIQSCWQDLAFDSWMKNQLETVK